MSTSYEKIPIAPGHAFRLLRWTDNVREVEICLPGGHSQHFKGAGESWHFHSEIELTLVTRGRGKRFVGDHVSTIKSPDLVLIGSNLPHYWSGLYGSSGYSLQFACTRDHPLWQMAETEPLYAIQEIASSGKQITGPMVGSIRRMMERIASCGTAEGFIQFLKILSTITELSSEHLKPLSGMKFSFDDRNPHLPAISKAVQFILDNFRERITLENILECTEMTKPTFCRQFKRHTGQTLMTFINQLRVDRACQHLIESDKPITEIAYESGYSNLAFFNRQFKDMCGCTPREFRVQNRSASE